VCIEGIYLYCKHIANVTISEVYLVFHGLGEAKIYIFFFCSFLSNLHFRKQKYLAHSFQHPVNNTGNSTIYLLFQEHSCENKHVCPLPVFSPTCCLEDSKCRTMSEELPWASNLCHFSGIFIFLDTNLSNDLILCARSSCLNSIWKYLKKV